MVPCAIHRPALPGRRIRLAAGFFCCLSWPGWPAAAQTYTNPLSTTAFPPAGGNIMGPADPCVIEHEGLYYVYPTGDGTTYKAMTSEDLIHWAGNSVVFQVGAGSPWKQGGLWAPEVERIAGRFYLYYTAGDGRLDYQRIGVADSASPLGPFVDRSLAAPLIPEAAIDAECFQDGGELYLYYVRWDGALSIHVRRLQDPLTLDATTPPQLCISAAGWEATVNEGPSVFKRGNTYYMLYSGNYAHTADYAVGVATADHPMGPWRKQPAPYNPVFRRNNGIGLYGPGHGHPVIGPDGLSDWYVYHQKLEPTSTTEFGGLNYRRHLALDRLEPVSRAGSTELRFTSSGGTTGATPAPRMPFEHSRFEAAGLPVSFREVAGSWTTSQGKLTAPSDGRLELLRPLDPRDLQDFRFEWWLQAAGPADADSSVEFKFSLDGSPTAGGCGFRIVPAQRVVQFVESASAGAPPTVRASAGLDPALDWSADSRRLTLRKSGGRWTCFIDNRPVLETEFHALVGDRAIVQTAEWPLKLDGYRQTVALIDDFECASCTSTRRTVLAGTWTPVAPQAGDDGCLRQSDRTAGFKMTVYDGPALSRFDLGADFKLISQITGSGRFPKHGLVHNYVDPQNFCMVFIDDQYDVLATNAVIEGSFQEWVNGAFVPATFAVDDYRRLAVTMDATTGDFVYSLNGEEILRRGYAGAAAGGRAGLITELSEVLIDNFSFSGRPEVVRPFIPADLDADGDVDQSDFGRYQACITPLQTPIVIAPGCADADLDGNGRVGAGDLDILRGCMAGASKPVHVSCEVMP